MRLVELELKKERGVNLPSALLLPWCYGGLLGMGPRTREGVRRGSLQEKDLWDPQEMGAEGRGTGTGATNGVLLQAVRLGDWIWENTG